MNKDCIKDFNDYAKCLNTAYKTIKEKVGTKEEFHYICEDGDEEVENGFCEVGDEFVATIDIDIQQEWRKAKRKCETQFGDCLNGFK
jgi:hypothetical protein